MSCLFDPSEGHDIFPIRKNEIDNSSGSCGTTFPCTGKASGQRASVKREERPPCVKGALPEGRWGIVRQAGGTIPPSRFACHLPLHKGGFIRTVGDAGPYGCVTGACDPPSYARPF